MDKVKESIHYVDTDSVFYVEREHEKLIPTGSFLGEMTDEIKEPYQITCFLGGGPKNYAYKMVNKHDPQDEKHVIKVRGITMNYRTRLQINFDYFKQLVKGEIEKRVVENPRKIKRKANFEIVSESEQKTHQSVHTKRRKIENFETVPYGI